MIRVGRCTYSSGKKIDPEYPGFTKIVVMMKSHSKWWPLSPYELKNDNGHIMENIWQFSKVYATIPQTIQYKSRYDKTIIWSSSKEKHYKNGQLLPAYHEWRHKGMNAPYAIRYPVGFENRSKCLFALKEENGEPLNYIESRKAIYVPVYCDFVRKQPLFTDLQKRLQKGEQLLIVEVDGPHSESLSYYQENMALILLLLREILWKPQKRISPLCLMMKRIPLDMVIV